MQADCSAAAAGSGPFGWGSSAGGAGATGLSPEQEALLRAALERMGSEAAIRAALADADIVRACRAVTLRAAPMPTCGG